MKTSFEPGTFLHYHAHEFQTRLAEIEIPGVPDASWDRRAAYMLWLAEGGDGPIGIPELPKRTVDATYRVTTKSLPKPETKQRRSDYDDLI